jgi:hypothetical protein
MKKKEERNEKQMTEIMAENKRMSEPLQAAMSECEALKKQLQKYEKDKLSHRNAKARLKRLEEQFKELQWEHEILESRYQTVEGERKELENKYVDAIQQIQQKNGLKNMVLQQKIEKLNEELEKMQVRASGKESERLLEEKNVLIRNLQYELNKQRHDIFELKRRGDVQQMV